MCIFLGFLQFDDQIFHLKKMLSPRLKKMRFFVLRRLVTGVFGTTQKINWTHPEAIRKTAGRFFRGEITGLGDPTLRKCQSCDARPNALPMLSTRCDLLIRNETWCLNQDQVLHLLIKYTRNYHPNQLYIRSQTMLAAQ